MERIRQDDVWSSMFFQEQYLCSYSVDYLLSSDVDGVGCTSKRFGAAGVLVDLSRVPVQVVIAPTGLSLLMSWVMSAWLTFTDPGFGKSITIPW